MKNNRSKLLFFFKKCADENEQFFIQDSPLASFRWWSFFNLFFNGPALSQGFSTIENPQEAIHDPTQCTMKDEWQVIKKQFSVGFSSLVNHGG